MVLNGEEQDETTTLEHSITDERLNRQTQEWSEAHLQAERLKSIINSAMDGVITVDESQRIVLFNYAAEAMFLCSAAEAMGKPLDRFCAACREHLGNFDEAQLTRCATGVHKEIIGLRANGEEFPIEASFSLVESGGQKLYTVILRDITERKSMEEELRDLGARLISVQDEERRRIAMELHDDLNQRVAMLSIELDELGHEIPKRLAGARAHVKSLRRKSLELTSEIQRLSYHLHSAKLDHLGLVAALQGLCSEVSEHQGLKIEFKHSGFPAVLPKEIRLCIFRVTQESLHNVVKHSSARRALVVLEKTDQSVRLSVSDEGCGFDVGSAGTKGGLGLLSMKERLRVVGGDILIQSEPSQGTRVDVSVPLTRVALMGK